MKRRWQAEDAPDNPESSRRRDVNTEDRSNGRMGVDDPILQSNHKIFLSHSGAQKDFVEQLCRDLENRYRFPFFDRRPSSLPKGERFPELILKAARQCQMAVVVVSEEYFVSKWPMIELHAFVQARLKSNPNLKILPLFYKLSVREFCDEKKRDPWFSVWEELAKVDPRINVDEWKDSLKMLASFTGIEYNPDSRGVEAYREFIVTNICNEVPSDIKRDDSHVQGRSTSCKELRHRIDQIQASRKKGFCLIGIYGVGGIGKTTICKILCNELSKEFKGNVSHVEFGSGTYIELLKEALKDLTTTNQELLQKLDEGECKHILQNNTDKYKIFLAIDNVWDDSKSIEETKMYLQAHFHEESIVMVTSRSLETLTYLGISKSHCFEMPSLGHEDAKNLFLHHAAYGTQFSNYDIDDKCFIEKCVALCYFRKGENKDGHYLPLALKALGVQLGCVGKCPCEWVKALPKVRDFNYLQEEKNPVFSILRSSFDRLQPIQQNLFMDLILYSPTSMGISDTDSEDLGLIEWLSIVYNRDLQEIESQLQHLKGRGLVEDVDMTSQRVYVHDLYREFAKLESKGNLSDSAAFKKKRWVYYEDAYPTELEMTPSNRCWQNLIRIRISGLNFMFDNQLQSLQEIEWRYFSNVVVLKLDCLSSLKGELNLNGLKCLRSLDLAGISGLDSLDGLQDLNNLFYFRWIKHPNVMTTRTRMGQLPGSLKFLLLEVKVLLRLDLFAHCTNLSKVKLSECCAGLLDFSNCSSLQCVEFRNFKADNVNLSNCTIVRSVELTDCRALFSSCTSLQSAELSRCRAQKLDFSNFKSLLSTKLIRCSAEKLDFSNCASLQTVTLEDVDRVDTVSRLNVDGLQDLTSLTCFTWTQRRHDNQVHTIMGQLPGSLKVLHLEVEVLLRPDAFARCSNLSTVELSKCRAEKLDFSNCASLQTVTLEDVEGLDTVSGLNVDGLQDLTSLTCFTWTQKRYQNQVHTMLGQLPASLNVLHLEVEVLLRPDVFAWCSNLSTVELSKCRAEKLDFSNCAFLQTVTLEGIKGLDSVSGLNVDGLQDLTSLTCFTWTRGWYRNQVHTVMGQLPASLKVLHLEVEVLLRPDVFARCTNLSTVKLSKWPAEELDFSNCASWQTVTLVHVEGLDSVSGLNVDGLQDLTSLTCFTWTQKRYQNQVHTMLGQLPASLNVLHLEVEVLLRSDVFARCTNLSTVELSKCRAEKLDFSNCASLQTVTLQDVEGLDCVSGLDTVSGLNVDGLQDLTSLTCFTWTRGWYRNQVHTMMGQLPASLKVLHLEVEVLLRPDVFARCSNLSTVELSKCRTEKLDFSNCASLQTVTLEDIEGLDTVSELDTESGLDSVSGLNVDGLQDLTSLTCFTWTRGWYQNQVHTMMGQLPLSLKVLHLEVEVLLRPDVFALCTNLSIVELSKCRAEKLDFSNCASLQTVTLEDVEGLDSVRT